MSRSQLRAERPWLRAPPASTRLGAGVSLGCPAPEPQLEPAMPELAWARCAPAHPAREAPGDHLPPLTLPAERLQGEGWTLTVSRAGAGNPWAMPEVLQASAGGKVKQAQTTRPSIFQHQTEPALD